MKEMKVVFLDFDGVINNHQSDQATGDKFSKECCGHLNSLLDLFPELRIVVSSTWRMWGLNKVRSILYRNRIDPAKVIDITGNEPGPRGLQIQAWLDRNPYVKSFVILDDDMDMEHLMKKLVHTNAYSGLSAADIVSAAEILKTGK